MKSPKFPQKFTKIVATLGPATESEEMIEKLVRAGLNVARFNVTHGTPEWHLTVIKRVRNVAKKLNTAVGVLYDLVGPETRIELPEEKSFDMKRGDKAVMTHDRSRKDKNLIYVPKNIVKALVKGNLVSLADGTCEFEIIKKYKNEYLVAKALNNFSVHHRKTMNTPGIVVNLPPLVKRDYEFLDAIKDGDVDFVSPSFIKNAQDVKIVRRELEKRRIKAPIISKVENQAALDNIEEIIEESDGIMVARGDLAVEVPFEQLAYWQKLIIQKCRDVGKPVITATQMLKSMIDTPVPTRAEVSDIANSIYDKTSAVMLSGETTIGKYPDKCVATQAKIAAFNEPLVSITATETCPNNNLISTGIINAVYGLITHPIENLDAIICLTETGDTATKLAKIRPKVPIHAITSNFRTYNKMTLSYGVIPHIVDWPKKEIINAISIVHELKKYEWIKTGQRVAVVHGETWKTPGETNTLSLIKVPR